MNEEPGRIAEPILEWAPLTQGAEEVPAGPGARDWFGAHQ
jgi:hypothetical protein